MCSHTCPTAIFLQKLKQTIGNLTLSNVSNNEQSAVHFNNLLELLGILSSEQNDLPLYEIMKMFQIGLVSCEQKVYPR